MPPPHNSPLRIAAIICAAGSGTRFGVSSGSKLDKDIHGKAVLERAVEAIASQPDVVATVVAGPADPDVLAAFRSRHEQHLSTLGATICPGGVTERYETVKASLDHIRATLTNIDAVLVHDAARPCTPRLVVRRVIDALASHAAVVPAVPIGDTLKRATPESDATTHRVDQTINRRDLFACQTPQGFHLDLILRAYDQSDLTSTDDAQLVERLGDPVLLVTGDPRNVKITRPEDLDLVRAIWPTL
ncbi:MAG: 2-C-methyl-D-erythritol 4-phosphate cytidylyltransferase [Phycisphaera sp.]|nr:MAG: 2-C-methyl-D-erythritol 4-phosphate cytidylyltransferase [Phycisphaera sp.]